MERFEYIRATSLAEAVALLNEPGLTSRPLAGGTDLVLLLHASPPRCERVVDISLLPELRRIHQEGDRIIIGAAATHAEVAASPLVSQTAAVLSQACRQVGAVQIRNMATLGGNVANAAACADTLPALVCLDAVARVVTSQGEYEWPVAELVRGPHRTQIPPGGLLVALSYLIPRPGSRSVFLKLGRRKALSISRLTVAALGRLDGAGKIAEARFAPGSATPQVCRFKVVEDSLIGQAPGPDLYRSAARLAAGEMIRLAGRRWSTEFKEPALMAMTARALAQVFEVSA